MNPWNLLLQGLGQVLAFFYSLVPNYGIAIILLTIAVSIVLFPLTLKQTRSMKSMQEIQPEIKALQKEWKQDRQELNKRLMELYQERGVNPAAGCLPLIVQLPIWFALFSVLRIKVNDEGTGLTGDAIPVDSALGEALLNGETSFLSMDLLSSPSDIFALDGIGLSLVPYLILIVIVMGSGYVQQIQTTRRRDDTQIQPQQQTMQNVLKIMPLVFGFISWGFPTGLVLYFAASNLFRVGQQAYILRLDGPDGDKRGKGAKPPPTPEPTNGGEAERTGPSPHASKKKKSRRRR